MRILSIDGGGIRGIIPASVLAEIERVAAVPAHELFDLIAGTSTGGLIALGLTVGDTDPAWTAADLVELYCNEGPEMFTRRRAKGLPRRALQRPHDEEPFKDLLHEYFGGYRLSRALTDILVPTYDLRRREPFFFNSNKARRDPTQDYAVAEVARAASAAPTFFRPAEVRPITGRQKRLLIDGGVFANSPALCALVEARRRFPRRPLYMVSLGTGNPEAPYTAKETAEWRAYGWGRALMNIVGDGLSEVVDQQVAQLFPSQTYERFQCSISRGQEDMDDASDENLRRLRACGKALVRKERVRLAEVAKRLAV